MFLSGHHIVHPLQLDALEREIKKGLKELHTEAVSKALPPQIHAAKIF